MNKKNILKIVIAILKILLTLLAGVVAGTAIAMAP